MWRSVPQIDAAATSIRTSPAPGFGTGASTSSNPGPGAALRSARMVVATVTAEGYLQAVRARERSAPDAALRGLHPGRCPSPVGVVDRGPRRDDGVDRIERGVVE